MTVQWRRPGNRSPPRKTRHIGRVDVVEVEVDEVQVEVDIMHLDEVEQGQSKAYIWTG